MIRTLQVLLVDDNADDRALVRRVLDQTFGAVEAVEVVDSQGLARAFERGGIDLAITDYDLRWTTGVEVLHAVKAHWPETPVIMFTGTGSEEIAVAAMKDGLDDYVLKSPRHFARLAAAARAAVERAATLDRSARIEIRLHRLLDHLNVGVFRSTREGRLLEGNAALLRLLGLSSLVEAQSRNMREFYLRPEDRFELLTRLKTGGSVHDHGIELRKATGETIWVSVTEMEAAGADGEVVIDGVMEDITERKRAARQLEDERNFISAILDTAAVLVVVLDRDGRIVRLNRAGERITDYSLDEVQGRPVWDVFVPPEEADAYRDTFGRLLAGQFPLDHTGHWNTRAGTRRLVSWTCTSLPDRSGDTPFAVWTGVDVTERRHLEQQLRQMQKLEAIGRLAGGVAHDFNNLLTTILGYSALLGDEMGPDAPGRSELAEIRRAADRAANLTRQLLAFSRQQVLQPRRLDLNTVLAQLAPTLERMAGPRVAIELETAPELPSVSADPGQTEQVVMNLAMNAIDAMPHGGVLTIQTAVQALGDTAGRQGTSVPPGPYVMLRVSDTGTGMDAATQLRLFEPFFSTKDQRTGLGLATTHGIVSQSGGYIDVSSRAGHGTTFRVYLPAADATTADAPGPDRLVDRVEPETILLVDDEDQVRTLLGSILRRTGYRLLEASNGQEGLATAARHDGAIQLLITDVVMPRMSGPELAERLKDLRPGLKVLYISGYAETTAVRHGVLREGSAFLQKPFTPPLLMAKVREVLDSDDEIT